MGLPLTLLVGFGALRSLISLRREIGQYSTFEASLLTFATLYLLFIGAHKIKFAAIY